MKSRSPSRKSYSGSLAGSSQRICSNVTPRGSPTKLFDGVEQQQQRAAAARGLFVARDLLADDGLDAEFFAQLASESLFGGLAGLDLAAGKLPLQRMAVAGHALANQQQPVPVEDSGDHNERAIHKQADREWDMAARPSLPFHSNIEAPVGTRPEARFSQ